LFSYENFIQTSDFPTGIYNQKVSSYFIVHIGTAYAIHNKGRSPKFGIRPLNNHTPIL